MFINPFGAEFIGALKLFFGILIIIFGFSSVISILFEYIIFVRDLIGLS